ncbi:alpha/beta hydrolase [Fulvimarina endophytica]|uniref:Alpha/beta hydrolase n=1 Tax=Fulvimarina endophytica TaxID=2293836 RepID=A0A371WXS8_9HYPH|nr:alpha/beta hydrolase [Fulvimarina endophytica]RFC61795.1 alpha/beta hydrolase [Fulvimarina endophytica]
MIETLIVPGLNSSPAGHWQHHWAVEDPTAELVEQENWSMPVLADWLPTLEAQIMAAGPGVVLVAHSLGCALVTALASRPAASHISGALLVAPADIEPLSDRYPAVAAFRNGEDAKLPFAALVVASRTDPFMSFSRAEAAAKSWGAGLYDLGDAGHINIASGHGPWAEGPALADGLRGRTAPVVGPRPFANGWWTEVRPDLATSHGTGLGTF